MILKPTKSYKYSIASCSVNGSKQCPSLVVQNSVGEPAFSKREIFMHRIALPISLIFLLAHDAQARDDKWCDEALKCYGSARNAALLAKTMREDGYGVKWDTVKELEKYRSNLEVDTFLECLPSDEEFRDAAERDWDRRVSQIKLEGKQATMNSLIVAARYCSRNFGDW